MRHAFLLIAALVVAAPLAGCKAEQDQSPPPPASPGVARCLRGLSNAHKASTANEANSIYYEECSDLFSIAGCKDAYRAAAKADPGEQFNMVSTACRAAYCPSLTAFSFDMCRDDFAMTPESVTRAWPPLFDAILSREAGSSTPEVSNAMLGLYAHLHELPPPASSASAEAAPSGAPSASGAPPASAAPSGSAPTAVPAGSAHGAVVGHVKEAPAKPAASKK